MEIDAEQFVGVKGVKARGRRVTTFNVASVTELEPLRMPEPAPVPEPEAPDNSQDSSDTEQEDEESEDGQLSLF